MVTSLSCIDNVSDLDIVQYMIAGVQLGGGSVQQSCLLQSSGCEWWWCRKGVGAA